MKRRDKINAIIRRAANGKPAAPPSPPATAPPAALGDRYRPFPTDALPPRLRALAESGAASVGCDPVNFALPGIVVLAAAVGDARVIEIKPDWREPAILWAAVIGESSSKKSPGFRAAVAPLYAVQNQWFDEWRAEMDRFKAGGSDEGRSPPRCRQIVTGDSTVEAVAGVLADNPRGLLVGNQELDQWFASFTRYSGNGRASDRARWLPLYDADTLVVNRKSSGATNIRRAAVSVVGGIQPAVLCRAFTPEARASGLSARFLLAAPPRPRQGWTDDSIPPAVLSDYRRMVEQLLAVPMDRDEHGHPARLTLTPDALEMFRRFVDRTDGRINASIDPEATAVLGKSRGWAARLALVFALAEDEIDPAAVREVGSGPMAGAIALAEWFAAEAERITATNAAAAPVRDVTELRDTVERMGGSVTARDLQRANRSRFPTAEAATAELDKLQAAGCGRWLEADLSPKRGRPTRRFVLSSPATSDE